MNEKAVRAALGRVLASRSFARAARLREFLSFVVEAALDGHTEELKGHRIGVAVFARPEGFDAQRDSLVRVEAQRLRHALESYYAGEGRGDPIRIEIPKGRYVPVFTRTSGSRGGMSRSSGRGRAVPMTVLPFSNLSGSPNQDYLAEGLTGELAVALGHHPNLDLLSGLTSSPPGRRGPSPLTSAQELGARFVLEGGVRRTEDGIHVAARLHDVAGAVQVWGETYRRQLVAPQLFDVLDEIVRSVVAHVADLYGGAIGRTLSPEAVARPTESLTAYDAVLRFLHYEHHMTDRSYRGARQALEDAVEADPDYAMAKAALACLRLDGYTLGRTDEGRRESLAAVRELSREAIALDRGCELAHYLLGLGRLVDGDVRGARDAAEALLRPGAPPTSVAQAGFLLAQSGEWDRGVALLEEQMRLLGEYPGWLHAPLCMDRFRRGDFEQALAEAQRVGVPSLFWDPLLRAASLGMLGRTAEARAAGAEIRALRPDFPGNPRRYLECYIADAGLVDALIEGLSRAGLGKRRATRRVGPGRPDRARRRV